MDFISQFEPPVSNSKLYYYQLINPRYDQANAYQRAVLFRDRDRLLPTD